MASIHEIGGPHSAFLREIIKTATKDELLDCMEVVCMELAGRNAEGTNQVSGTIHITDVHHPERNGDYIKDAHGVWRAVEPTANDTDC